MTVFVSNPLDSARPVSDEAVRPKPSDVRYMTPTGETLVIRTERKAEGHYEIRTTKQSH